MTGQEFIKQIKAENRNRLHILKVQELPDYRKQQLGIDEKFIEEYSEIVNQDDFMDSYYQEMTRKFIMCLPQEVQEKLSNVVVGVIPSFTVNASAIVNVECDDNVIILHAQLLSIISQFCELQILIGKNVKNKELKNDVYMRFKEIVNCYIYQNYALKINIINSNLDVSDFRLISNQTIIIEMFIIAHELAHIFLGHCKNSSSKEISLHDNCNISIYEHRQLMELEADRQAFEWLIEVFRNENYDEIISFYKEHEMFATEIFQLLHLIEVSTGRYDDIAGEAHEIYKENEIFCRGLLVLKELEDILSEKKEDKNSHPLAMVRLANLICNRKNEVKMQEYMMDSFWNALFFESYDVRDI